MVDPLREGEAVVLKRRGEPGHLARLARGPQPIGTEAVVDLTVAIGRPPGVEIDWLGHPYRVLRPSTADLLHRLRRGAQIVTSKDAIQLLYLANVQPGDRVLEAGSGSGALTVVVARAVGPTGRVVSYDRRADFLGVAQENVRAAGLDGRVSFRLRDVGRDGFDERDADAVLIDVPEPWTVVEAARDALAVGGHLATYTPTYNQLERTVRSMRDHGFDEVRALELLERALHVADGGTRPEFDMLGHTGFLAAGRRVD